MKIVIQGFWGAKVQSIKQSGSFTPEEVIKDKGYIVICSVIVDGKYLGDVTFDGKKLAIVEEKKRP